MSQFDSFNRVFVVADETGVRWRVGGRLAPWRGLAWHEITVIASGELPITFIDHQTALDSYLIAGPGVVLWWTVRANAKDHVIAAARDLLATAIQRSGIAPRGIRAEIAAAFGATMPTPAFSGSPPPANADVQIAFSRTGKVSFFTPLPPGTTIPPRPDRWQGVVGCIAAPLLVALLIAPFAGAGWLASHESGYVASLPGRVAAHAPLALDPTQWRTLTDGVPIAPGTIFDAAGIHIQGDQTPQALFATAGHGSDFAVTVTVREHGANARNANDEIGLALFGDVAAQRFLTFEVHFDGAWAIDLYDAINNTTPTFHHLELMNNGYSRAVNTPLSQPNRLTVIARGDTIDFFVNGAQVSTFDRGFLNYLRMPATGAVGVYDFGITPGVTADFQGFTITPAPGLGLWDALPALLGG